MTQTHIDILREITTYCDEVEKFEIKGVKASAARARKALGNIGKLAKTRRAEIQETKNNM